MGRRAKREYRVLGPYPKRGRDDTFVGYVVHPSGRRESETFTGSTAKEDCQRWKEATERELGIGTDRLVGAALEDYEKHRREVRGNRAVTETTRRLELFFPNHALPVRQLDRVRGAKYYEDFAARRRKVRGPDGKLVDGPPISVDYHRNTLAEAKTFLRWCIEQGWLKTNPLEGVQGRGKRRTGKTQLHGDEARRFELEALRLADDGDHGAIAALLVLYCGLRASEITHLRCRDVDSGGSLLWVGEDEGGRKTERARRQLGVPLALRAPMLRARGRREGDAWLWGELHWRNWPRTHVRRICELVGVKVISAHGMRGTHGALAARTGLAGELVAQQLGHEQVSTTERHYSTPEAREAGSQVRVLSRLGGNTKSAISGSKVHAPRRATRKRK